MKKKLSPLQRFASANWELFPYDFHRLPLAPKKGLGLKVVAKPIKKGKTLFVLAVITFTGGCSGFHPRVDAHGGELLLCVDTSREDRCYKPEPKSVPVEDTDLQR